jgi:hypothetical protein
VIRRRLPLPANCARCPETRQVPCSVASQCARGTEPHAKGREVMDYSTSPRLFGGQCPAYMPIAYAGTDAPVAPRTHDAPEGLR